MSHRSEGPGSPNLNVYLDDPCGLLGRFELIGHGPSWTAGLLAKAVLKGKPVDLNDGSIDFIGKLIPLLL